MKNFEYTQKLYSNLLEGDKVISSTLSKIDYVKENLKIYNKVRLQSDILSLIDLDSDLIIMSEEICNSVKKFNKYNFQYTSYALSRIKKYKNNIKILEEVNLTDDFLNQVNMENFKDIDFANYISNNYYSFSEKKYLDYVYKIKKLDSRVKILKEEQINCLEIFDRCKKYKTSILEEYILDIIEKY